MQGSSGLRPPAALRVGKRAGWSTGRPVSLLHEDPSLARSLPPRQVKEAIAAATAATMLVDANVRLQPGLRPTAGHMGCLVIQGFIVRRVEVATACSLELLGPGDLVRPWQEDSSSFCVGALAPLTPVQFAVLDERFSARIGQWPEIAAALVDRALARSRSLATLSAIGNIIGIEHRIMAFFWYLAERWGRRSSDCVEVDVPLTHGLIADLVGARRPPVSSAIARLVRAKRLWRHGSLWVLRGDPPGAGAMSTTQNGSSKC